MYWNKIKDKYVSGNWHLSTHAAHALDKSSSAWATPRASGVQLASAGQGAHHASALADSSDFGLLEEQSSQRWDIRCLGRRWATVLNFTPLALSSAEKSVSVTVQNYKITNKQTRRLYCVEWTQYSTRLDELGYLCDCLCGRLAVSMRRSVIIAELWRPEVARIGTFSRHFCVFLLKRPLIIKFSKLCSESLHRDTDRCCCEQNSWKLSDGKSVKACVIYLTEKTIIFRLPLKLWLLRGSRPKSAMASPQHLADNNSKFHRNRFTFGGVIAGRVKAVQNAP